MITKYYVAYDPQTGDVLTRYDSSIQAPPASATVLEVVDQQSMLQTCAPGWKVQNNQLIPPPPAAPPTQAEQLAALEIAVQQYLDQKAQAKGYDSAASCISYLSSSNTTWAADAKAMNAWRDAVWGFCFTNEAAVKAGTTTMPTATELIAALPVAPW